jgi:Family of unknown function (DUF6011)
MSDLSLIARLPDCDAVHAFCLGGAATFTLVSTKTGARFTFRIAAPKQSMAGEKRTQEQATLWFVSVLTGPDNTKDFAYLGLIKQMIGGHRYEHGRKSRLTPFTPAAQAFNWFWAQIAQQRLPSSVEVWHQGQCCRCGRALTVPSSIASGVGPECAQKGGF